MTSAIHPDADVTFLEHDDELQLGELADLIGVENPGTTIFGQYVLQRFDTEVRGRCVRQPQGEYLIGILRNL